MEEGGVETVRIKGGGDDDGRARTDFRCLITESILHKTVFPLLMGIQVRMGGFGTLWTTTAHVIAAIIGSGVLTLPWSVAQLGWAFGILCLVSFGIVTYYAAVLLCDCYRSPDPETGRRNHTYREAVRACSGAKHELISAIIQYGMLWGMIVGYTITTATSVATVKRSHCFRHRGHDARCNVSGSSYMMIFGASEIILSQFPNMEKLTVLSVIATITSFGYSFISVYLCTAKFASNPKFRGGLINHSTGKTQSSRIWHYFQALGNIAFAYSYSHLLIEIQDTVKSPPSENKTMKRATMNAMAITTIFCILLGCMGYAAFGEDAPGNILTGFYQPFWLVDVANISVIIHLLTAYQVYAQPLFALNEKWLATKWPTVGFFNHVFELRLPFFGKDIHFTLSKLLLRPAFVFATTLIALIFPFFNAIVGLLGAISFWPLTVYFPVRMYIVQTKIKRGTLKWKLLQGLSMSCLVVSIIGAMGSVADIIKHLKHAKLFHVEL